MSRSAKVHYPQAEPSCCHEKCADSSNTRCVAFRSLEEPSRRVFNIFTGNLRGQITLSGYEDTARPPRDNWHACGHAHGNRATLRPVGLLPPTLSQLGILMQENFTTSNMVKCRIAMQPALRKTTILRMNTTVTHLRPGIVCLNVAKDSGASDQKCEHSSLRCRPPGDRCPFAAFRSLTRHVFGMLKSLLTEPDMLATSAA